MDENEKNDLSTSSKLEETTPLLIKQKDLKIIKPTNYSSVTEPACGSDLASAGSSSINDDLPTAAHVLEEDEMAEQINSYEGVADVVKPDVACGLCYGYWLCTCYCLSRFMIQFPLHVLMLSFPISIGYMGAIYRTQCPMDEILPYAIIVIGSMGALVLLVRITLLLHTKFSKDELLKKWIQKGSIVVECAFLICLIFELCWSYKKYPINDPVSSDYCNESFYSFVISMNDALIAVVVVRILLYFITRHRCMQRVTPP